MLVNCCLPPWSCRFCRRFSHALATRPLSVLAAWRRHCWGDLMVICWVYVNGDVGCWWWSMVLLNLCFFWWFLILSLWWGWDVRHCSSAFGRFFFFLELRFLFSNHLKDFTCWMFLKPGRFQKNRSGRIAFILRLFECKFTGLCSVHSGESTWWRKQPERNELQYFC